VVWNLELFLMGKLCCITPSRREVIDGAAQVPVSSMQLMSKAPEENDRQIDRDRQIDGWKRKRQRISAP